MDSTADAIPKSTSSSLDANPAAPLSLDGSPQWDLVTEELRCPLCDYNLRGLAEPRCPECGYRFAWSKLLDPKLRLHPYLFEHHPESNVRSFIRTTLGGLRPTRFWSSLQPAMRSRRNRLLAYWFTYSTVVLVVVVAIFAFMVLACIQISKNHQIRLITYYSSGSAQAQEAKQSVIKSYGSVQRFVAIKFPTDVRTMLNTFFFGSPKSICYWMLAVLIPISWAPATFVVLMVFQKSMRRARIKPIHVLRCTVYSGDIILWLAVTQLAMILIVQFKVGRPYFDVTFTDAIQLFGAIAACLIFLYRLTIAYRGYLCFAHPFLTVLASQIIVALFVVNLLAAPILWFS